MAFLFCVGCGQNYSQGPTQSSPATQQATPTAQQATPISQLASPPASGFVTLEVAATSHRPGDTVSVILKNSSSYVIYFLDHQTSCTFVLLQKQVNGTWENINNCALGIASGLHTLDAKQQLTVNISPPRGLWTPGFYRATLRYNTVHSLNGMTTIASAGFSIG